MVTDGLVIVDKPGGMTSHDVVARIRRLAKTRRVGHGGTLDPMATGVLVIGVNRATRLLTYVIGASKSYSATIRLGQSTDTDDAEGRVLTTADAGAVTEGDIRSGLAALTGEIDQVPSAVSAIKVNGVRAYKRVRDGEQPELAARRVTVHKLTVSQIRRANAGPDAGCAAEAGSDAGCAAEAGSDAGCPAEAGCAPGYVDVDVDVTCSSGTYIRAIARDLGAGLGVGGHLTALRRTAVGQFTLAEAATLEDLEGRSPDVVGLALPDAARRCMPYREATADEAKALSHGAPLAAAGVAGPYAVFAPDGTLVAVVAERDGKARPEAVFQPG